MRKENAYMRNRESRGSHYITAGKVRSRVLKGRILGGYFS